MPTTPIPLALVLRLLSESDAAQVVALCTRGHLVECRAGEEAGLMCFWLQAQVEGRVVQTGGHSWIDTPLVNDLCAVVERASFLHVHPGPLLAS